jgi:hypothetical protein
MAAPHFMAALDKFTDWALFDGMDGLRPLLKEFRYGTQGD